MATPLVDSWFLSPWPPRNPGNVSQARKIAKEFHDREYDFAIDERKIRLLLGSGSKNKALAQLVVQKFSKNGKQ